MEGDFISRHDTEPRVHLNVPKGSAKRIIPNSTEVCWRDQDNAHKSGCIAGKTHQWLLERRCGSNILRFVDRIHEVHVIEWETSSRIYVVRGVTYEDPSNYHIWLSVAWDFDWYVKSSWEERQARIGFGETKARQRSKTERHFCSLIRKMESIKRSLRTQERHWKFYGSGYPVQDGDKKAGKEATGNCSE